MSEANVRAAGWVAVLADCHVHPGGGPDWTRAVLQALEGADLIVTLGDMGESAGLDRLGQIAPVVGVAGADDEADPRTEPRLRRPAMGGATLGCVFDPVAAGLAVAADPFSPVEDFGPALARAFGRTVDVLLYASTHKPAIASIGGIWAVNPGSALLPAKDAARSFARLTAHEGKVGPEIVSLA